MYEPLKPELIRLELPGKKAGLKGQNAFYLHW